MSCHIRSEPWLTRNRIPFSWRPPPGVAPNPPPPPAPRALEAGPGAGGDRDVGQADLVKLTRLRSLPGGGGRGAVLYGKSDACLPPSVRAGQLRVGVVPSMDRPCHLGLENCATATNQTWCRPRPWPPATPAPDPPPPPPSSASTCFNWTSGNDSRQLALYWWYDSDNIADIYDYTAIHGCSLYM